MTMTYDDIYQEISAILRGRIGTKASDLLGAAFEKLSITDVILDKGESLYRAQIGGDLLDNLSICAYKPERMFPDPEKVGGGRFSEKGHPVFYFAMEEITALKEVRPWHGAEISVAEFLVKKPLKLASIKPFFRDKRETMRELFGDTDTPTKTELTNKLGAYLFGRISSPQSGIKGLDEYCSTRMLAKRLQAKGYDGIIFKSSTGQNGVAGALFYSEGEDILGFYTSMLEFKRCDMRRVSVLVKIDHEYGGDGTVFSLQKQKK